MAASATQPPTSDGGDDAYSVVERLADTIRIQDDAVLTSAARDRLVQDLYEGPRRCECCINWVPQPPPGLDVEPLGRDADADAGPPLVVRHRVLTSGEGRSRSTLHSVEVHHRGAREVLARDVFAGYDHLVWDIRYLSFLAPFRPFFWRWDRFERAIAAAAAAEDTNHGGEDDNTTPSVHAVLRQLRGLVRAELAEAFAVSAELLRHGRITDKYLWTLFPPGELVYSREIGRAAAAGAPVDRFFVLESSRELSPHHRPRGKSGVYRLACRHLDWDGERFGLVHMDIDLHVDRTNVVTDLYAFPARFLPDLDAVRSRCVARGRKFRDLAGIRYVSYGGVVRRPSDDDAAVATAVAGEAAEETTTPGHSIVDRRIVVDAMRHPTRERIEMGPDVHSMALATDLIVQAPLDVPPPGGHRPLRPVGYDPLDPRPVEGPNGVVYYPPRRQPDPVPPFPVPIRPIAPRRRPSTDSFDSVLSDDSDAEVPELDETQLLLCPSDVPGYCLRRKMWRYFSVDRIRDIQWNSAPFDSLVLPDGYKDLILSFVESQLKDGDTFDDVINGKGGGMVILLAGEPGVGKTLTAESVAEKLHAPLYKLDLGTIRYDNPGSGSSSDSGDARRTSRRRRTRSKRNLLRAFELAARWKAVLLIDECDAYLARRDAPTTAAAAATSDQLVARFLQELEYYPSLLFLTTNREPALDPAVHSRVHLTIRYPPLDRASRLRIWSTFLGGGGDGGGGDGGGGDGGGGDGGGDGGSGGSAGRGAAAVAELSEEQLQRLAELEVNGRRIRNAIKTAGIVARREKRPIRYGDIARVMRITEGVTI